MSIQEIELSGVHEGDPIEPMLVNGVAYEFSARFGDGNLTKAYLTLRHMGAGQIGADLFAGEDMPHAFFRHPELPQEAVDDLFSHLEDTMPEYFKDGEASELDSYTFQGYISNAALATGLQAQLDSLRS